MRSREHRNWMWAEAVDLLHAAETLQRQFFQPGAAPSHAWQPPVDVFDTGEEVWIVVALPGVRADQVHVVTDGTTILVSGERPLMVDSKRAVIHRLEIPYGRFERSIGLPRGRFQIVEKRLEAGCLVLGLGRM